MTLNYIWIFLFLTGFVVALIKTLFLGEPGILSTMLTGIFDSAKTGFEISIGLTGIMSLWLGLMKVGEKAGVISSFSKLVSPFFRILFKGVPKGHPAYGNIMMNFSANMLGLDNAATPLGLKAMADLQELNPEKEKASDAQIMFLVLNTAGITLIPSSVIAIRQTIALQQHIPNFNAADIFLPTLIATFCTFIATMFIVGIYQRINLFKPAVLGFITLFTVVIGGLYYYLSKLPADQMAGRIGAVGSGFILVIMALFLSAGLLKKQNVYDNFIEGAKDGFNIAIRIIPYLVAMLLVISVFRTSGCMEYLVNSVAQLVKAIGLPNEWVPTLPIALMKTLSGSGARGLMVDVMTTYGVDSFEGKLAAIIQGSTETTFYVLAVYFGSVNIKNTRYALTMGLIADFIGLVIAIVIGYHFFR